VRRTSPNMRSRGRTSKVKTKGSPSEIVLSCPTKKKPRTMGEKERIRKDPNVEGGEGEDEGRGERGCLRLGRPEESTPENEGEHAN